MNKIETLLTKDEKLGKPIEHLIKNEIFKR
jgi:hypothetical protein